MNCTTITRTSLAVLVGLIWTGSAVAQLTHVGMPGKVRNEHPRIYATQADLERIRQEANVGPAQLPTTRGTIKFTLVPTAKGTNDKATADLFGQQGGTADNRFYMRYTEAEAPTGRIKLQIVAANANAATTIYPKLGKPTKSSSATISREEMHGSSLKANVIPLAGRILAGPRPRRHSSWEDTKKTRLPS